MIARRCVGGCSRTNDCDLDRVHGSVSCTTAMIPCRNRRSRFPHPLAQAMSNAAFSVISAGNRLGELQLHVAASMPECRKPLPPHESFSRRKRPTARFHRQPQAAYHALPCDLQARVLSTQSPIGHQAESSGHVDNLPAREARGAGAKRMSASTRSSSPVFMLTRGGSAGGARWLSRHRNRSPRTAAPARAR